MNHRLSTFLSLIIIFCVQTESSSGQQSYFLRGTIRDAATNAPLGAANVRLLGTSKGTISNALGVYALSIDSGAHQVVFSYLGYTPDTLSGVIDRNQTYNPVLHPSAITIPEMVVFGEDPALEIIRKAIATKHQWMDKLFTYQFEAYTRQVLHRDTTIAGITESYSTGFARRGDTLREIIRQKRQTLNVATNENFAAVRHIVNFNDDIIDLLSLRVNSNSSNLEFVGPTAPNAFENYDYKLLNTRRVSGKEVYQIRITPRSRFKPLLEGTISIADGTFAVMGVDVTPNETFSIPFLSDVQLRYQQQFSLYDSIFWMPTNIHITGGFTVSIVGISLPRISVDLLSTIYDYKINAPFPDSILLKPRVVVDSAAVRFDSAFWKKNEVLPLTTEEQHAYATLDSTQSLEKQFEPKGPLAALASTGSSTLLGVADIHFNRVEGFYLGASKSVNPLTDLVQLEGSLGIGLSDHRLKHELGVVLSGSHAHNLRLGGSFYNRVDHVPDGDFYGSFPISLMALLGKNDYRDYYLAHGFRIFLQYEPRRWIGTTLTSINEHQTSLAIASQYSLFSHTDTYRPNPVVTEGMFHALRWDLRYGPEADPIDLVSRDAVEFSIERAFPTPGEGTFNFTQYSGRLMWNVRTFLGALLFPPTLRLRVSCGTSSGEIPPQRIFSLDSRATGFSPFGTLRGGTVKEFKGNRFAVIALEHNFRNIPFILANIPFLAKGNIELLTHATFAQVWMNQSPVIAHWYSEAGIGFSRIFDFLRIDFSRRFTPPSQFVITFGVATWF